jgi:FkbM family methyltransferase
MKYYIRGFIKFWIDYFLTSSVAIQIARLILWRANVKENHIDRSFIFADFTNLPYIATKFIEYFHSKGEQIENLKENLLKNTDELSHDVVNRCCSTYKLFAEINQSIKGKKRGLGNFYCVPMCSELSKIELADAQKWESNENITEHVPHFKLPGYATNLRGEYVRKRSLAYIDRQYWHLEGRDVLDCGANIGQSALIFSELGVRSIHSFEPAHDTFATLVKTIKKNKKEDIVIPIMMATGDKNEILHLYSSSCNSEGASVIPNTTSFFDVKSTTIDEYVHSQNLDVAVIKLDVEGAEYATIIGATETIKKYKPILLISIYHTPKDFFEIKPYLEKLDIGYTFMIRQSPYNVYWNGYELLGYIPH